MNFVIISPHFPPNYWRMWTALKERGVNTLGIGEDPYGSLAMEVRDSLTEYYRVDNMANYEEMLRACGHFTFRYGKIDRIESNNEFWLETDARLRTDFNVQGLKTADMPPVKYKSIMKSVFQKAGIPTAPGILLKNPGDGEAFVRDHGYPVIAKPDNGVGAYATYKLHNDEELKAFLAHKLPVEYFMESFIRGKIHSFDGLTDGEGRIVFSSGLVYGNGVMEAVNEDLDMFIFIPRKLNPKVAKAGKKVIKAFDLRERFFHLEFFLTEDNELIALELNARPPGGMIPDMINYSNDFDVYQLYARLLTEERPAVDPNRRYNCFYMGRKDRYRYVMTPDEVVERYPEEVVFHGPIDTAFAPAMGNYGIIIRTPHLARGQTIRKAVMKTESLK